MTRRTFIGLPIELWHYITSPPIMNIDMWDHSTTLSMLLCNIPVYPPRTTAHRLKKKFDWITAATKGNVEALKWLQENNFIDDSQIDYDAARRADSRLYNNRLLKEGRIGVTLKNINDRSTHLEIIRAKHRRCIYVEPWLKGCDTNLSINRTHDLRAAILYDTHIIHTHDLHAAFLCACEQGRLDTIKWFFVNYENDLINGFICAAEGGQLKVLKLLYLHMSCSTEFFDKTKDYSYWRQATYNAIECGHLRVVKWLYSKLKTGYSASSYCAAGAGQLEILKWLQQNYPEKNGNNAVDSAVFGCRVNVVNWILEQVNSHQFPVAHANHYGVSGPRQIKRCLETIKAEFFQ